MEEAKQAQASGYGTGFLPGAYAETPERDATPFEMAQARLGDEQNRLLLSLESLAYKLEPILKNKFVNDEKAQVVGEMKSNELVGNRSPLVRETDRQTSRAMRASEIVSYLLNNLEI